MKTRSWEWLLPVLLSIFSLGLISYATNTFFWLAVPLPFVAIVSWEIWKNRSTRKGVVRIEEPCSVLSASRVNEYLSTWFYRMTYSEHEFSFRSNAWTVQKVDPHDLSESQRGLVVRGGGDCLKITFSSGFPDYHSRSWVMGKSQWDVFWVSDLFLGVNLYPINILGSFSPQEVIDSEDFSSQLHWNDSSKVLAQFLFAVVARESVYSNLRS